MKSDDEKGARDWARHVIDRNDNRAERLEMAAVEAGNLATKAMFLVNGGACIALLSFLAATLPDAASSDVRHVPRAFLWLFQSEMEAERVRLVQDTLSALKWFGWGVGFSVFAAGLAYLTNSAYARALYARKRSWEWPFVSETNESVSEMRGARILNLLATISGFASLGMFVGGMLKVQDFF